MQKPLYILLAISLAVLIALFCLPFGPSSAGVIEFYMAEPDEIDEILGARRESLAHPLKSLQIGGQPAVFDKEHRTFFYSLAGEWKNPEIELSDEKNLQLIFQKFEISPESIRSNTELVFYAYDDVNFYPYTLKITTLPLISLYTGENSVAYTYSPCSLTVCDGAAAAPSDRVVSSSANIRIRGSSSLAYPKKSFRLTLVKEKTPSEKKNLSLLGMRSDDDWILYAAYNDPDKMRDYFAHELWKNIGAYGNFDAVRGASDGRYVELFMNNTYWGLYVLRHPLDGKEYDMDTAENPGESDYLYRTLSYVDFPIEAFYDSVNSDKNAKYEIKYPNTLADGIEKWLPLMRYIELTEISDFNLFRKNVYAVTDIENVVNLWLFLNATCAVDNVDKNLNIAAKHSNGTYRYLFSPWDLDQTWANRWASEGNPLLTKIDTTILDRVSGFKVATRLIQEQDKYFIISLADRWKLLRSGTFSDRSISDRIDGLEQMVFGSGAILRDEQRWPLGAYSKNTGDFRSYVAYRLSFVDSLIAQMTGGEHPEQ